MSNWKLVPPKLYDVYRVKRGDIVTRPLASPWSMERGLNEKQIFQVKNLLNPLDKYRGFMVDGLRGKTIKEILNHPSVKDVMGRKRRLFIWNNVITSHKILRYSAPASGWVDAPSDLSDWDCFTMTKKKRQGFGSSPAFSLPLPLP